MITIKMTVEKPCKHSIRFGTKDPDAAISNVYVSRAVSGVNEAQSVTVTLSVDGAAAAPATKNDDAALLAALK